MTEKEWYAQISTLVLEGIDQINKGQPTIENKIKIKRFVIENKTPLQRKADIRKKISLNVSEALKYIGHIGGLIFLIIAGISWLICAADGIGYGTPIAMLFTACVLEAIGIAGQTWNDITY